MRIVVALEQRFNRTPDAVVWTPDMFAYPVWRRYHPVFDQVHVVARVQNVEAAPTGWLRASGDGVSFQSVPHYLGPLQYLRHRSAVRRSVVSAVQPGDAVLLRLSSQVAMLLMPMLYSTRRPYGVLVVGDPYDVFAPGTIKHPLRPFFRHWFSFQLRRQCRRAVAAAYVTRHTLQRRYPVAPDALAVSFSDVDLPPEAFVGAPRLAETISGRSVTFLSVGTMEQLYKAFDIQIAAVASCVRAGLDLRLVLVGVGKHRAFLETLARDECIADRVDFLGQLPPGAPVRDQMDRADLFMMPSRTEGLPRAMIEAMARGLPCIGSTAGGIPELLAPEDLVPPGDAGALAAKITEVLADPARLTTMSERNLRKAREYGEEELSRRAIDFYRYLRSTTEEWLAGQGAHAPDAETDRFETTSEASRP